MDIKRYELGLERCQDGWGMDVTHPKIVENKWGSYVKYSDLERFKSERDALQLRLNAVEEENDRLRCLTVDLRNCNFQGYNPDGSGPIVYAERPDGLKEVVGIKMDGWYCEGPRKEGR